MPHQFYLAPLRGVTDVIFRTVYEKYFGTFDFMLTPFLTTLKGKTITESHCKDITGSENDRTRLIPQMLGNDSTDLLTLSNHIAGYGYPSVNLNLGCPHPPVAKKKRGSGLLPYPELVEELLAKLTSESHITLSVKVRLGYLENSDLEKLMPVLNRYPLSEVTIHPRTGKQVYSGKVDLDKFKVAASLCTHPVVYNGDICSLADFADRTRRFPEISRFMIGRGCAMRPELLAALKSGIEEKSDKEKLRSFHDDVFAWNEKRLCGPSHLLGKMKEFWSYLCHSFIETKKVHKIMVHSFDVEDYKKNLDRVFLEKK